MDFRMGVIGAGTHGERYVRHGLNDVPGLTVTALCRRSVQNGQRLAAAHGVRYHAEAAALIADPGVDGVVVCTPPAGHFPLASAVISAGKPLLLEKPMTGTLGEARLLADRDASAHHPLMLAQSLRWNPVLQQVRRLWPQLGRVRLIRLAQRLAPTALAWQQDLAQTVGGSVLLTGVHLFDLARWLSGAEFLTVDSRQRAVLNPVVEDQFLARGCLADGCWVSLEVSKHTDSRACWLEAVGDRGQLVADYLVGGITLRCGKSEEKFDTPATVPALPPMLADWLRAVRTNTPPPVCAADGVATLAVVDACYRSAAMGKEVAVETAV